MAGTSPRWSPQLQALGGYIKAQRQLANLTLRQMAELAEVSNPYLSQIERGMHQPSVRVLKSIARALDISTESLLTQAGLLEEHDQLLEERPRLRRALHRGAEPPEPAPSVMREKALHIVHDPPGAPDGSRRPRTR